MKNILLALLSIVTFGGFAQKNENALLWKISGNGLTKPSYLFGTLHILCDATLDKNTTNALDATQQLYLELDMDDPSLQASMMGGMMMKDGKTMSSLTSPEDFKIVDEFLTKQTGYSAKMLNTMVPQFVSVMLMPKMLDCPVQSIEGKLMEATKAQGEEVRGLETVEVQLAAFDAIPYEDQMKELVRTAKDNMAGDKQKYMRMLALYKNKDLNGLMAYMHEEENRMYSDHADVMLDNRNASWIPVMEAAAKEKPTFFGVGAAHLGGPKGVIALLRKKGYKVEAVQ